MLLVTLANIDPPMLMFDDLLVEALFDCSKAVPLP